MSCLRSLVFLLVAACSPGGVARPSASEWVLESQPSDGDEQVPLLRRLTVRLDRLVQPRTVDTTRVTLRSGEELVALSVLYEPVSRELRLEVDADDGLEPYTTYLLAVDGLVDLDGEPQEQPYRALFSTSAEPAPSHPPPVVEPGRVLGLLAGRCTDPGCHGASAPAAGLDLSSHAAVLRTAVAVRSTAPAGTTGVAGSRGSLWLAGLPRLDVRAGRGAPATSYLLYKAMGDPHLWGEPMPPIGEPLSRDELAALSTWIAAGAPDR